MYESIISERDDGSCTRVMALLGLARAVKPDSLCVHLTRHGGIVIENLKGSLSGNEAKWLSEAIAEALEEHRERMRKADEQWLLDNGDKTEHDGFKVDLSINETKRILKNAVGGMVEHEGILWKLARTDLKDDVCTTMYTTSGEVDYTQRVRYGARLRRHADGRHTFAVVDSWSDG